MNAALPPMRNALCLRTPTSLSLTARFGSRRTEAMFSRLVKQLSEKEGVTEALKAENQMLWVQRMNNLRNTAAEIVSSELIYC
ncbi:TnpV protein [Christensenella sp. MSJ-20]|uniref:TnpV protein n=1 Tax=Christensenella sp. MSJ-20 TaxID=2841518 RepID=UPI0037C16F77